jgi:hypothetical protein
MKARSACSIRARSPVCMRGVLKVSILCLNALPPARSSLTLTPTKHEGRRGRAYCGVADRAEDRAAGKRERNGTVKI